jgi:polyhydroxybutyrate depolymerase
MTEDVQLAVTNTKMPAYEQIDGSSAFSRRRLVALFAAVGLVLTIVAVGAYSISGHTAGGTPGPTDSSKASASTSGTCSISGTTFRTLNIAGITRSYKIVVPSGASFPAPLIVAWHGIASDVTKIEGKMKLLTSSASTNTIIVYPEAKNKGGSLLDPPAFNGAGCCKESADFKDEEFFAAIANELISNGCVASNKIYVMGFSNGGFMTNRVSCATATRSYVRAACVHSGLIGDYGGVLANSPWMNCSPKPVLSIHGTSDSTVPIAGGKNPVSSARWFSQDQVIAMWATGCSANPVVTTLGAKLRSDYDCGSHNVSKVKHEGFGHDWHAQSTEDCITFFDENGRLA